MRAWAVFLLLCLFSLAARANPAPLRERGELTWGGDLQGGEPYVFEDPAQPGRIVGFEVEIAEALARKLGMRAKFHQNDWSNLVPALERGDFDIVLNGLEDTPARRARLRLSVPYFVYGETLAFRRGAAFHSLEDLAQHRVGTLNQTMALEILKAHRLEVVLYEGQQEPYLDLSQGRIDAVLLDHVIADRYGCVLAGISCLVQDLARGTYVIGMRKDDVALGDAIDRSLSELIARGELRQILERYKLWDSRQEELMRPLASRAPALAALGPRVAPARLASPAQLGLFVQGALITLLISLSAFAVALPLGVVLAVTRLYAGRWLRFLATAYVEIFRGTPLLLQLYVLYYGLASVVRLGPLTAAILGLGLNYAAYEAEVQRGALLAVPDGQRQAGNALGLSEFQTLRHVLLPQALRVALPAVTNDFVALLKDSSLVSVITVVELTKRMTIAAVELRDWVAPGILCAGFYFALSFPLSRFSLWLERRGARA